MSLPASTAYEAAIADDRRRIRPLATMDIVDPDIGYGGVTHNGQQNHSRPAQLYDKNTQMEAPRLITLERGRMALDGSFEFAPADATTIQHQQGFVSDKMSNSQRGFDVAPYVQLNVSNLSILQAAAVHFTGAACDGVGEDFRLDIYSGSTVIYTKAITGNSGRSVYFEGFTVYGISALRVTVTKWGQPNRFCRLIEIVPGTFEEWDGSTIKEIDIMQEADFTCLTAPYGSCSLTVDNQNKRFNPYSKNSIFLSLEEKQPVPIKMGVELPDGSWEYKPLGVYYQQNGGWQTDAYGLTFGFKLVDIIGLLSKRKFIVPATRPTTVGNWVSYILSHLGNKFSRNYVMRGNIEYSNLYAYGPLDNMTCVDVLRHICIACMAWFRADATTGRLRIDQDFVMAGNIDLRNMYTYPAIKPQDKAADITVRYYSPSGTAYTKTIRGGMEAADKSLSIDNPFISSESVAEVVGAHILKYYSGIILTIKGRGDMRTELGDVDTVETGFDATQIGRRYKQQFKMSRGVLKESLSCLLADDELLGGG